MILRPRARDQFYSWYVNSKHDWSCLYNFSLITFAQICLSRITRSPMWETQSRRPPRGRGRDLPRHQNQGKTKMILTRRTAPTIAKSRSKGIMTRGRLSGKREEDCDKDRKSNIDEAKIRLQQWCDFWSQYHPNWALKYDLSVKGH